MLIMISTLVYGIYPMEAVKAQEGSPLEISAESAILIDRKSGAVLFAKNENKQMAPASITKIVTAIIALETSPLNDMVTVSKRARGEEGTRVYLEEGEQQTMENLIYALMVNSGNDAGTAIAEHISGSNEAFSETMNVFVREQIQVTNSQFMNPHGLPDQQHFITAADMAKIAQYAMNNQKFREIVATKKKTWNGLTWKSQLVNHNKLLSSYQGATGLKNGYTSKSGHTLVASALRNDMELIGVILNSKNSKSLYKEMTDLLDYGFEQYSSVKLFEDQQKHVLNFEGKQIEFIANAEIITVIPNNETPNVLVDHLGNVSVKTSLGTLHAGSLLMMSEQQEQTLVSETDVKMNKTSNDTVWSLLLTCAWFLMNLFLLTMGYLMRKKRKKEIRYTTTYWNSHDY
ncbi:hypothetical protein SY83_17235 [Paenibacillus swuensis]|uniref:Peptidase S11 D-alanyl-D-alanine carboxypeptidase A N-terminal domain-containing protein n=1 Tax=Paenibacillus swuensis TaxID=1178515 RepID=A0A172TL22_9BACL|nr:D-alanyl-D-alanine carboxypeptidase family protein [Paenibacillus swuensis]ANE47738.1 hypothetical protein SY83_17235 [Paenibacillus swuensis]